MSFLNAISLTIKFSHITTGFGRFARSRKLPEKGAAPGKEPPAKNWPAKISLPGGFYRTPGKDFAESKHNPRQRKVTITAPAPSVLSLPGAVSETPNKDFLNFFPDFLCRALAG
jgi:hypothetical protein